MSSVFDSTGALVPSMHERRWAAGVHLGAMILAVLTGWAAGIAGMVGAGAVAAIRPMDSEFVARHAREAFNFNASIFLYAVIGVVLAFLTLGIGLLVIVPFWIVCAIAWLVCSIIASTRALDGREYRYPLTIRLWK